MRWCPAPNCSNAIKAQYFDAQQVQCTCGHVFCFGCGELWHDPVKCKWLKKWIKKLPKHTIVVLQTLNDFDEFKEQTQLSETLFSDTLKIETSVGTITRNMLIGRT